MKMVKNSARIEVLFPTRTKPHVFFLGVWKWQLLDPDGVVLRSGIGTSRSDAGTKMSDARKAYIEEQMKKREEYRQKLANQPKSVVKFNFAKQVVEKRPSLTTN